MIDKCLPCIKTAHHRSMKIFMFQNGINASENLQILKTMSNTCKQNEEMYPFIYLQTGQ